MLQATALQNLVIGGQFGNVGSIYFEAETTSPLAAVRLYEIIRNPSGKSGYDAGTDGIIDFALHADNKGQPGTLLAEFENLVPLITEDEDGNFPLICFPPTTVLVQNALYHIVARNTDPKPQLNYCSLDYLINPAIVNQTPDIRILVSQQGGLFVPLDKGTVMGSPVQLYYSNGVRQGYDGYQVKNGVVMAAGAAYGFLD